MWWWLRSESSLARDKDQVKAFLGEDSTDVFQKKWTLGKV